MKFNVTIDQDNIESALVKHLESLGVSTEGKNISVELSAGRGLKGFTAEITVAQSTGEASVGQTSETATTTEPVVVESKADAVEVGVEDEAEPKPNKSLFKS